MECRPLSPVIGAEVLGVDVRTDLAPSLLAAIHQAFARCHLLVFHNQDLSFEDQTRFSEHFGPAIRTHRLNTDGQMYVSNAVTDGAAGDGALGFHQDHSFFDLPDTNAISLYGIEVPAVGGNTVFANAQYAYETLPLHLKAKVSRLHARHVVGTGVRENKQATPKHLGPRTQAIQPVVWWQPDTQKSVLYISDLVEDIVGLDANESAALLDELRAHLYRAEFLYSHHWQVGDLIIWSNRTLQHGRTDFDATQTRTLRRWTVGLPEKVQAEPQLI